MKCTKFLVLLLAIPQFVYATVPVESESNENVNMEQFEASGAGDAQGETEVALARTDASADRREEAPAETVTQPDLTGGACPYNLGEFSEIDGLTGLLNRVMADTTSQRCQDLDREWESTFERCIPRSDGYSVLFSMNTETERLMLDACSCVAVSEEKAAITDDERREYQNHAMAPMIKSLLHNQLADFQSEVQMYGLGFSGNLSNAVCGHEAALATCGEDLVNLADRLTVSNERLERSSSWIKNNILALTFKQDDSRFGREVNITSQDLSEYTAYMNGENGVLDSVASAIVEMLYASEEKPANSQTILLARDLIPSLPYYDSFFNEAIEAGQSVFSEKVLQTIRGIQAPAGNSELSQALGRLRPENLPAGNSAYEQSLSDVKQVLAHVRAQYLAEIQNNCRIRNQNLIRLCSERRIPTEYFARTNFFYENDRYKNPKYKQLFCRAYFENHDQVNSQESNHIGDYDHDVGPSSYLAHVTLNNPRALLHERITGESLSSGLLGIIGRERATVSGISSVVSERNSSTRQSVGRAVEVEQVGGGAIVGSGVIGTSGAVVNPAAGGATGIVPQAVGSLEQGQGIINQTQDLMGQTQSVIGNDSAAGYLAEAGYTNPMEQIVYQQAGTAIPVDQMTRVIEAVEDDVELGEMSEGLIDERDSKIQQLEATVAELLARQNEDENASRALASVSVTPTAGPTATATPMASDNQSFSVRAGNSGDRSGESANYVAESGRVITPIEGGETIGTDDRREAEINTYNQRAMEAARRSEGAVTAADGGGITLSRVEDIVNPELLVASLPSDFLSGEMSSVPVQNANGVVIGRYVKDENGLIKFVDVNGQEMSILAVQELLQFRTRLNQAVTEALASVEESSTRGRSPASVEPVVEKESGTKSYLNLIKEVEEAQ